MNKKVFVVLGVFALLTANAYAQRRPFKMAKQVTEAMIGAVPSAFSHTAPVSFVSADMLGRKIATAQFVSTNTVYLSSQELFRRVSSAEQIKALPVAEQKSLESRFSQLDLQVKMAHSKELGYIGALWSSAPAVQAQTLQISPVQSMTQLLDVQRYMQLNNHMFPQIYTVNEGGWLQTTDCLTSVEGNRAFMGVIDILVKEQSGQAPAVVVEQLVALHNSARNKVAVVDVVKQLEAWRAADNDPASAPKLPQENDGVSLRHAESLWLASEIRLLQLTPGIELPEILKTAQVIH